MCIGVAVAGCCSYQHAAKKLKRRLAERESGRGVKRGKTTNYRRALARKLMVLNNEVRSLQMCLPLEADLREVTTDRYTATLDKL